MADHADFGALYQELGPDLIRYLRRLLHNNDLAEDIAQDAFLTLMRKWPEVRNDPNPKAWLYSRARRLAIAMLDERSREFLKGEPPDQEGAGGDDPSDGYNVSLAVREAVWKLPPRQREAVWLFYFQDFKQNEIATIMQIQRGAVGALLSQARSRLAGLLDGPGGEGFVPLPPPPPARAQPSLPLADLDRRGPRETISPPAVGDGPPGAPPSEPSGRGGPTGPRQRYLLGQCPDTVQPGKPFSLLVRIATSGGGAALKSFDVPEHGADVLIVVHAPELRILGGGRRVVRVPPDGDSEPVMFELQADALGARRVSVTAWQAGNYLGELPVEVMAVPGAGESWPRDIRAALSTETVDGAVSLEVRYDPVGQAYRFQFHDIDNPREEQHSVSYDPGPLVENLVNELDSLARGEVGYSAAETRDYLMDAGARLWQQLLPQQIRDQFWERQQRIRQLTIIADQDAVPWELLYPMDPGHDAGFLVEQFPVTRDLFDRPALRRSLRLRPARFVLPPGAPTRATAEIAALSGLIEAGQPQASVLSEFSPLRELITEGGFGMLHFACHNGFSLVGGPSIVLDNRPFTVTSMQSARIKRTLQSSGPLIFVNACRSAGQAATYNRLDGWADAFMQAGAGAFIGSLWSVTDEAARNFASEFYRQLMAGSPLGEAVAAARRTAASQPGDPTWLAYTVYGHPYATVASC